MDKYSLSALAALALFAPCAAWAQPLDAPVETLYEQGRHELPAGWKPLARTESAAMFLHSDVRGAEGGKLAVWVHEELAAPEYFEKDQAYLSVRERMLVDCKAGRTGISDWVAYAGRFGAGGMIAKEKRGKDMSDAVPDSPEAQLLAVVCAPKPAPPRRSRPAAKAAAAKAAAAASVPSQPAAGKSASAVRASAPAPAHKP